ncbi:hypothetical protein DXG01_002253 [Tephrocybe rancida]|nr:hypothetical protein DXG01_002253 [Tephrocybe rancida]
MIAVELPVLSASLEPIVTGLSDHFVVAVLWILFLVNGALTAQWKDIFYPFGCGDSFNLDMFLYTATLLVFALVGQSRGNTVWKSSVSEADFFTVKPSGAQLQPGGATVYLNTGAYPPAPMQQLPVTYQYASPAQPYNGLPQV